jgi:arylsulfatase A-like enzyme
MRWIIRAILVSSLVLVTVGLFARPSITSGQRWLAQFVGWSEPRALVEPTQAGRASDDQPDTELFRAVDELLDRLSPEMQRELADGRDPDTLRRQLLEADDILARVQDENRQALRQANRQVRVASRATHVVLVVVEGLKQSDLSAYGQTPIATPEIDHIAADGFVFRDFYESASGGETDYWSLMTGMPWWLEPARPQIRACILPETLWQGGYTTVAVGDLSAEVFADLPGQSWDSWKGLLDPKKSTAPYPSQILNNGSPASVTGNHGNDGERWAPDLWAELAGSEFSRLCIQRPVFTLVSMNIPDQGADAELDPQYNDPTWTEGERLRASAITRLDAAVGRLNRQLSARGLAETTVLMIVGIHPRRPMPDAGAALQGEGLRTSNLGLHEGDLRRPCIVRLPKAMGHWQRQLQATTLYDIAPTIYHLTQTIRTPQLLSGRLLVTRPEVNPPSAERRLLWTIPDSTDAAVRVGRWKLIRSGESVELYDLMDDLRETQDRYPAEPDVADRLNRLLPRLPNNR